VDDLIKEIIKRKKNGQRVLVTTLTKRLAEALVEYLQESPETRKNNVNFHYLHAEVETLDRQDILDDLRSGKYDVVVGINLLREGLDLPEVSLVAILDADKEGFLRSKTSLIQTMGRAARHIEGKVIMYADQVTRSMREAIDEVNRRRKVQLKWNKEHHITPTSIKKPIREKLIDRVKEEKSKIKQFDNATMKQLKKIDFHQLTPEDKKKYLKTLKVLMREAAKSLEFEKAAYIRDKIKELGK
jgi:excinuclease ABC subunit B